MLNVKSGDTLSLKQLQEQLGISASTWKGRRETILSAMSLFYDFEISEGAGKRTKFTFNEVYDENKQYHYTRKNAVDAEKMKGDIWDYIVEWVDNDGLITGSMVSRNIKRDMPDDFKGLNQEWVEKQSQKILKTNYKGKVSGVIGSINEKVWVYLDKDTDKYIELTPEQQKFFLSCLDGTHNAEWCKKFYETINCEDSPLTPEEKVNIFEETAKSNWGRAVHQFRMRYGVVPFIVNRYANDNAIINLDNAPDWMAQKIKSSEKFSKRIYSGGKS